MIRKVSYLLISIFMISILFGLTSCKKNKIEEFKDLETVVYQSILAQDGKYMVFIYGDNCTYCEKLKPTIIQYAKYSLKNKDSIKIYGLNSSNTRVNKGLIATGGDESYDSFVNTTNYQDIHISTTPVLIIVNNGKVTKFISSKTTYYPKTEIETYITNLMK